MSRDPPPSDLPTIADSRRLGHPGVILYCAALYCSNSGKVSWEELDLPDDVPVIHVGRYRSFRCKKCQARNQVQVMVDFPSGPGMGGAHSGR